MANMSHDELDAKNMLCPMPVIKTQDTVKTLSSGDTLTIISTDPGALNDIPAWARINGHDIIGSSDQNGEVLITIKVQ